MITVALPVYKRKPIAWVALEGLVRQETVQPWELIVCEEIHDGQCGSDYFFKYHDDLKKAGCKRLRYIELDQWVNLPEKWRIMAAYAEGDYFLLQASDSWSDQQRIERNYRSLQKYDWTNDTKTHFYELGTGRMIMFDLSLDKQGRNYVGVSCGMKSHFAKTLPESGFTRGIDGYMYHHLKALGGTSVKENVLHKGLEFQGVNNISAHRSVFYDKVRPPYKKAELTVDEILPQDIIERLKDIKPENTLFMKRTAVLKRDWQDKKQGQHISVTGPVLSYLVKKGIAEYNKPKVTVYESPGKKEPQPASQGGESGATAVSGDVLPEKRDSRTVAGKKNKGKRPKRV